ncbi:hypothetical protein Moror_8912 [Moniliophthora roreri MCA 2997]|uniref:EF-hand domain-containing protein n=1 Tax=Moniliophthora roreri (strain MCA 2997) TaxID=1381753 RepID=V2YMT3_MONRO|nr:hypothetical protein Moror_8912 [Moniliophthora roreri MCA 2997]
MSSETKPSLRDIDLSNVSQNIKADQERIALKIVALVEESQERLSFAQEALETGKEAAKSGKEYIQSLLAPCKDAVAVLELVSQIHPAVTVVVGVFKVVIQLEMDRQENDRRIAALYFQMADLLLVLSYLGPVFEENDALKATLTKQVTIVSETINGFGNFCDVYYKHRSIVRTILSSKYKGKLVEFAERFSGQKKQLQSLVSHKSAVSVSKIKGKLEGVAGKIDKVLHIIESQNPKEKEIAELIRKYGGEAVVINNDEALDKIAMSMGETLTSSIKYNLRSGLDSALRSNVSLYELKVEATGRKIKDAVDQSTEAILLKLDAGPHDFIEDEDIRTVWKEMQWRQTCKVRHFVDAINHYYARRFAIYQLTYGEPHPEKWTLEFMSRIIFYPAIGDAIDDDGSGFVSIYEVNRFFRRKPEGWKSSEWIAYWGIGWYRNAITYKKRCLQLLKYLENSEKTIHPDNRRFLVQYLHKNVLGDIRLIVESVYTNTLSLHGENLDLSNPRFQFLRKQRMEMETDMIESRLLKTKFQIDSPLALAAICGTKKLEQTFLCLLSIILLRHKQIIKIGEKNVLSEHEFTTMSNTILNVTQPFETRLNLLLECWRQQRLDAKLQLQSYASGLFEDWWYVYYEDDDDDDDEIDVDIYNYEEDPDSDGESIYEDANDGEADDNILPSPDYPLSPSSILVYPLPPQPKETKRRQTVASEAMRELERVPISRRRARELALERRMDAMENQLNNIEALLRQLLVDKNQKKKEPETLKRA